MCDQQTLTREQADLIMTIAAGVPPSWHDRYVALCADHLLGLERIEDADIVAIADAARVRLIAGMPDD